MPASLRVRAWVLEERYRGDEGWEGLEWGCVGRFVEFAGSLNRRFVELVGSLNGDSCECKDGLLSRGIRRESSS